MNFGEMQQEVAALTKRPDKSTEIKIAINDAIVQFSIAATFSHDLVEDNVAINPTEFAQHLVISTTFPRFRKLHYLKPNTHKLPLKHINPLDVITDKGCEQLNRWYRSGDFIYFKLSLLAESIDYGYYAYPSRLEANTDTHWMLEVIPHVIRYRVMSDIFDSIGEPTDAKKFLDKANAGFLIAKEDLSTAETF